MAKDTNINIRANSSEVDKTINGIIKKIGELEAKTNGASKKTNSAFSGIGLGAITLGNVLASGISKGVEAITNSLGDAVERLDVLNNYPKVMSNLGISTDQSQSSINKLSEKLQGLPTTLQDGAMAVQRFASANSNIEASTDMFLALNNAILAGGAPMQVQQSALEQLSQAYSKGKPDMMEWRTALMAMPAQLKQVAMAMKFTSSAQLGEALTNNKVSMQDLMKTIVDLNNRGVAGFQSFADQARNSTGGVGTSIVVLQTALVRGLTDIMNAIGQANISGFFLGIANAINAVVPYVIAIMKIIGTAVSYISSALGGIFGGGGKSAPKASKSVADNMKGAAVSAGGLAGGAGDAAGGLGKAAKSAKEINKQLSGFDEMNVLTENKPASAGGAGGGAGAGGMKDMTLPDWDGELGESTKKASKLDEILKGLMNNPFVKGFLKVFESIGKAIGFAIEGVKQLAGWLISLVPQPIKDFFEAIAKNPTVAKILEGVAYALGIIAGAFTVAAIAVGVWNVIAAIATAVTGALSAVVGFLMSPVVLVIAAIAALITIVVLLVENWETVKQVATNVWNGIVAIWNKVASWFNDNVVTPIKKAFEAVFTPIATVFGAIWDVISAIIGKVIEIFMKLVEIHIALLIAAFKLIWETIKTVFTPVVKFFQGVWDGVVKIFTPVVKWFGDIFKGAWNGITSAFSNVASFFKGIWDKITSIFGKVGTAIGNAVSGAFKGVVNGILGFVESFVNVPVNAINTLIDVINKVPGVSVDKLSPLKLPRMARGGVVDRATMAVIGEAGREAVVPLENNTGWIDEMASKLAEKGGVGGGGLGTIVVKLGEETIYTKVIDGINDRSIMSGQNAIIV